MTNSEPTGVDLLVMLTRIETTLSGLTMTADRADQALEANIARVERDWREMARELYEWNQRQDAAISALRSTVAKAAGASAVVGAVVASLVASGIGRLFGAG